MCHTITPFKKCLSSYGIEPVCHAMDENNEIMITFSTRRKVCTLLRPDICTIISLGKYRNAINV